MSINKESINVIDLINNIAFGGAIKEKLYHIMQNHIKSIQESENTQINTKIKTTENSENSVKEIDDFDVLVKDHFKNYDSSDTVANEKFEQQL